MFDEAEDIIRKDYNTWDEVKGDILKLVNSRYSLKGFEFVDMTQDCGYNPVDNTLTIGIYSDPFPVSKMFIIGILADLFHELSHYNFTHKSKNFDTLDKRYIDDKRNFDTYVLNAIERPAWALSMAFKLIDLRLRPSTIVKLADEIRGTFSDTQEFMSIVKRKGYTDDKLLYLLYALSNTPKNSPRSLKLLDLLDKYFNKIWLDYLGPTKYARRGIPGFFPTKTPFL